MANSARVVVQVKSGALAPLFCGLDTGGWLDVVVVFWGHDGHNRRATGMQRVLALPLVPPGSLRAAAVVPESQPAMRRLRTCMYTTLHYTSTHPHVHTSTHPHVPTCSFIHAYAHIHIHMPRPGALATSDPRPQLDAVGLPEDDGPQACETGHLQCSPTSTHPAMVRAKDRGLLPWIHKFPCTGASPMPEGVPTACRC